MPHECLASDNDGAMNLMTTMMSTLSTGSMAPDNDGRQQPMPDLASIMSMVGPMLGALNGGGGGVMQNNRVKELKNE